MDRFFKKLHNRSEPPGLERVILRKLPAAMVWSTLLPIALAVIARVTISNDNEIELAKQIRRVDIFAIAAGVTAWTAIFTIAIGCVVVVIMKGPAYVADAYHLEDPDNPDRTKREDVD